MPVIVTRGQELCLSVEDTEKYLKQLGLQSIYEVLDSFTFEEKDLDSFDKNLIIRNSGEFKFPLHKSSNMALFA
jgi:hypothetical protein